MDDRHFYYGKHRIDETCKVEKLTPWLAFIKQDGQKFTIPRDKIPSDFARFLEEAGHANKSTKMHS